MAQKVSSAHSGWSPRLNALLNITLGLTLVACALVYTFPIFSNELQISGSTHDFGSVQAGTELRHQFKLRNLHPWPIVVTGVNSDCGCTRSIVEQNPPFRLAPFQSITVSTALNTRGRTGRFSQNVHVTTSDNPNGTQLQLRGEVR